MRFSLLEKLFPSSGPTKHASQMSGDSIPGAMAVKREMQRLGPKDSTTGQNSKGSRAAKDTGTAPHRPGYKKDGPKGATRQFEQSSKKVCPVCQQGNRTTNAHCGACGAVLPPRPEDRDGGIPANAPSTKKHRNWNTGTDGGTPDVSSPYGGKRSKHHYLKKAPAPMQEGILESQMPESSRMVLHDLLEAQKLLPHTSKQRLAGLAIDTAGGAAIGNLAARAKGGKLSDKDKKKLRSRWTKRGAKIGAATNVLTQTAMELARRKYNKRNESLGEAALSYAPQGVHDDALKMPALSTVNSKAKALGLNPITDDELNRVVGMFQQGETVGKTKLYTGVEIRLVQSIADMLGIGSSHGVSRGMSDGVAPAKS